MNKHTIFDFNKITKSAFAFVLAGSLSLTATTAFAEENEKNESQVVEETVTNEETNTNEEVISLDDALVDENTDKVEEPKLLPGDFFYFAKTVLEKIQLILTFDDVKEAKLLAELATVRLAEAEALFSAGQEEEALAVMEKALENLSVAEETVSENTDATEETTEEEVDPTEATEEDVDATIEIVENDEVVEETEDVEKQISQNIIALTAAMEKVKNPVAKASLKKNIEKSYEKLAKKMAKLEEKASKEESEEVTPVETENETTTEETGLTVVDEPTTEEEVVEENTEVVATPAPAAKATNQVKVDQAQKKAEKQVVKQEKKAEKEQGNKANNQQKSNAGEQKGNGKN
ncbi:Uncharacterised protein [Mycobacteroides abscessus subsp. abscessus]|nr:Uncharacterised protein [Mycobacteroides abscessus subsp. abscessus]